MNFQQKVYTAKELMQQISDNGGTSYQSDTFHYDREIGWEVHTDEAPEIAWHDFSFRSHETGLLQYRNLNDVIKCLREELGETKKSDEMNCSELQQGAQITINNITYNIVKVVEITRTNIRKYARATLYLQRGNTGTMLHEAYIRNDNSVTIPLRTGVKLSELG